MSSRMYRYTIFCTSLVNRSILTYDRIGRMSLTVESRLPTDLWFEIGVACGRYTDYLQLSLVVPSLATEERLKQSRMRLLTRGGVAGYEWTQLDSEYHSENDEPGWYDTGTSRSTWFRYGKIHRDGDKPAHIQGDVYVWYQNGYIHRDGDQPAYTDKWTTKYFQNGHLHRDGDLPAYTTVSPHRTEQIWYQRGMKTKKVVTKTYEH